MDSSPRKGDGPLVKAQSGSRGRGLSGRRCRRLFLCLAVPLALALLTLLRNNLGLSPISNAFKQADVKNLRCGSSQETLPKLPPWLPTPGRYLLAWCQLYGWSNRLYCTQRALILAALLNRTLIIPSLDVCVESEKGNTMNLMIDVIHMRDCLMRANLKPSRPPQWSFPSQRQRQTGPVGKDDEVLAPTDDWQTHLLTAKRHGTGLWAVSLHEYLDLNSLRRLRVDLLMCEGGEEYYAHCPPAACTAAGLVVNPNATRPPFSMYNSSTPITLEKVRLLGLATAGAKILSIGDTFYGKVEGLKFQETAPLGAMFSSPCDLLFQPSRDVFHLAAEFRATILNGSDYAALHFRRKDFEDYCGKNPNCSFWSIAQAADCLIEEILKAGLTRLFVASDGYSSEIRALESLLKPRGISISMFLPATRRSYFESSLVEKLICAQATVFFHQDRSTFSYNILQLRGGLGKNSCRDQVLCYGRPSGFVAVSNASGTVGHSQTPAGQ